MEVPAEEFEQLVRSVRALRNRVMEQDMMIQELGEAVRSASRSNLPVVERQRFLFEWERRWYFEPVKLESRA